MTQPNIQTADPYVGPTPIGTGQLLFGRSQEVRDLADLLIARRVVLLHSPSGAGKSSLINAGLIPELERTGGFHILPVMRVNHDLDPKTVAIANGVVPNRYTYSALLSLEEERPKDERLPRRKLAGMTMAAYLARRNREWGDVAPVLIFDQFEEIVTLDPLDMPAKEKFFEEVGRALADRRRWALLVMREDYIGAIEPYLRHLPTRLSVRMRLDLLSVEGAAEAICRPSRLAGRIPGQTDTFTGKAAHKLTADLRVMQVQLPGGQVEPRPGPYVEPMHLQVVCRRLWRDRPKGATHVSDQAIRDAGPGGLGTVDEALAAYYAKTVSAIARDRKVPERRIREWFTRRLIVGDRIRTQVMKEAEATEGLPNTSIDDLIKAYLVRQEPRRGLTWYELAHDRLVQPIVQNNKAWFASNLVLLQRRAAEWEATGQPDSLLLGGAELLDAECWAAEHEAEVEEIEKDFLTASRSQRARELGRDLAEMGWGIIFCYGADPAVYEALAPLWEHRRQAAGRYYREFINERAYRPGESAQDFVARQDRADLALSGRLVTQYLLIVGDPEQIPFEFQYGLSLEYVVGRIDFDTLEEYARYARSVVLAERDGLALPPRATFFAPRNPDDAATAWSAEHLVAPIARSLADPTQAPSGWQIDQFLAGDATRQRLLGLLGGPEPPALLFLAAHGMKFKAGSSQQRALSGAPVCADWPGPLAWKGEIPRSFLTTGDDVSPDAAPAGMIAVFFATDSAGTSAFSSFPKPNSPPERLADRSFTARLPQRLLAHPRGGALAVVGHVDVNYSEQKDVERTPLHAHFEQVVRRLIDGYTVGAASQPLRRRFALLSTQLSERLQALAFGTGQADPASQVELVALRTATADARNYVILGDPAVYLPVARPWEEVRRLTIEEEVKGELAGIQLESLFRESVKVEAPVSEVVRQEGVNVDQLDASAKGLERVESPAQTIAPPSEPVRREIPDDYLVLNGIDASTGDYYLPPLAPAEVTKLAIELVRRLKDGLYRQLRHKAEESQTLSFAVSDVDLADLGQAGWGLLLPADASPAIKEALNPLLNLRNEQVGPRLRILTGGEGYRPGETAANFLTRHSVSPGMADPDRMPYYLLLAGSPEQIPFAFQRELGLNYAVGRLAFSTPDEYARYAEGVVRAEAATRQKPPRAAIFSASAPGDPVTRFSDAYLAESARKLQERGDSWQTDWLGGREARKDRLARLLGGPERPDVLVMSGQSVVAPPGDPALGALLCDDWPGLEAFGPLRPEWYFSAGDLSDDAGLLGLIAIHLGSFTAAATPDDPIFGSGKAASPRFGESSSMAPLAQRLLGHPRGGMLAVVGYAGSGTWSHPSVTAEAFLEMLPLFQVVRRLMGGRPLGYTLEEAGGKYAQWAVQLSSEVEDLQFGKRLDPLALANLWSQTNETSNLVILGDPAVRVNAAP